LRMGNAPAVLVTVLIPVLVLVAVVSEVEAEVVNVAALVDTAVVPRA
jgi:hypothetical protein